MRFSTACFLVLAAASTSQAYLPANLKPPRAFTCLRSEKTDVEKSGERLNEAIEEHAKDVRDSKLKAVDEAVGNYLDHVEDSASKLKEDIHDNIEDITADDQQEDEGITERVKDYAVSAKDKVVDVAGKAKDKVKDVASSVKDSLTSNSGEQE